VLHAEFVLDEHHIDVARQSCGDVARRVFTALDLLEHDAGHPWPDSIDQRSDHDIVSGVAQRRGHIGGEGGQAAWTWGKRPDETDPQWMAGERHGGVCRSHDGHLPDVPRQERRRGPERQLLM
jgi:hypothetical protein